MSSKLLWVLPVVAGAVVMLAPGAAPADLGIDVNINIGRPAPPPPPPEAITFRTFYDRLAPYGTWVEHPQYGWVWQPGNVPPDWRPYTYDGRWVWNDEYGWLWHSDTEYGWAVFHYGRWGWDDTFGWFWKPGSTWAPAWVAWRTAEDGDVVGWAPLPPRIVRVNGRLPEDIVVYEQIPERHWIFANINFLAEPRREYIYAPERNVNVFKQTKIINHVNIENNTVINRGIDRTRMEKAANRKIETVKVRDVNSPAGRHTSGQNEVAVFRPKVEPAKADVKPPTTAEERQCLAAAHRQELKDQQDAQLRDMQAKHQQELKNAKNAEELRARHEAEAKALQQQHQEQMKRLEEQQKPTASRPPTAGEKQRVGVGSNPPAKNPPAHTPPVKVPPPETKPPTTRPAPEK